jgi:hypothetical protein
MIEVFSGKRVRGLNIEAITGETYVAQWISQEEVDAVLGR